MCKWRSKQKVKENFGLLITDFYLKTFSTVTLWKLKEAYGVAYDEWKG